MDMSIVLLVSILILTLIYWFLIKTYSYWDRQRVPCLSNPIPGFGHMLPIITLRQSMHDFATKAYNATSASVIGFYFVRKPAIFVRDPELVKKVLVSNFSSFRNNAIQVNKKTDPVLAQHPFFVADPNGWKMSRARTANNLSNRKLGQLFVIIHEVCTKMHSYVDRKIQENGGILECELKDFFTKYTGEVVANAAFGIEGQSFEDNPDKWSFFNVAQTLFEPSFWNGIKQTLIFYLPDFADLLKLTFLQESTDQYFRENLKAILKERKKKNTSPNDFLQFCIETESELDMDRLVADLIIFYGDVYETSSTTLSVVFYHLSRNQDVQTKLREDIAVIAKKFGGQVTYESLKEMNYLEQVIYEAMRITPPLPSLFKVCTEEITLEGPDGLKCHLTPGSPVLIPLIALNNDEKYWPRPHVFDPDRFSAKNQAELNKFAFLPFGEGPRQCIGMRLGLILVKLATASLIRKYSVEPSGKTKEPLEMLPVPFMTYVKGGLWTKFKKLPPNH